MIFISTLDITGIDRLCILPAFHLIHLSSLEFHTIAIAHHQLPVVLILIKVDLKVKCMDVSIIGFVEKHEKFSFTFSYIHLKVKKLRYPSMKSEYEICRSPSRLIKHHLLHFLHLFCIQKSTGYDIIKYIHIFKLQMR